MRINALLPIAGVVGGIYSAGFLFGYNYHKSYTEEESRAARESSPRSAPSDLTPQTEPEKPHETLGTNPLIYKFGLPVAGPTLHYSNHVLLYDQVRKIPRWVAETLTEVGGGECFPISKFRAALFTLTSLTTLASGLLDVVNTQVH